MANLKREFQKDDLNKLVPIQLLTTINASSPVETNLGALIQEGDTKKLTVRFPSDSSAMAFLVGSNRVEDVKISPPGFTEVSFDVPMNSKYRIYVVSKEYEDGFVYLEDGNRYRVRNDIPQGGEPFEFKIEDQDTTVDLNRSESLKLAVDPTDQAQWYNYSSHYAGDLIWQYSEAVDINSDNKYLIYKLDMLNHINNLAYTEEVGLVENPTERWQAVRALKVLHDTYNYLKSSEVQTTIDQYSEILEFYNSMNEFIRTITDDRLNLGSVDDGYKMLYYWAEKRYFADGIHIHTEPSRHWFNNNGGSMRRDDYEKYYDSLRAKIQAKTKEDWKIRYGATEIYAAIQSTTSQTRESYPGYTLEDLIQGFNQYLYGPAGEYRQMDDFFNRYNIPHSTVIQSNGGKIPSEPYRSEGDSDFFTYILGKADLILSNLMGYVRDQIEQTEELISNLGDFIFNPQSTEVEVNEAIITSTTRYETEELETLPLMSLDADYSVNSDSTLFRGFTQSFETQDQLLTLEDSYREMQTLIRQFAEADESDYRGPYIKIDDEVMKLSGIAYLLTRHDGDKPGSLLEPPQRGTITLNYEVERAQAGTSAVAHGGSGTPTNVYKVRVNEITEVTHIDGDQQVDDGQIITRPDGTQPLAHEATLQNIRFLKNQLTEINNNVWSSVNGANSVVVGAIHRIEQELFSQGVNYTQTNLTNPFISESDVDVYYSMVSSDKSMPTWTKLNAAPTIIADQGIIMLNLNELKDVGKYLVSIRPKKLKLLPINNTDSELGTIVLTTVDKIGVDGLTIYNNTTKSNAYKSWNIQVTNQNGSPIGPQRIIVASEKYSDGYVLQVSPKDNLPGGKTDYCSIWSNKFEPIMIDLDIVEHNNLTLSYSMYGEREFNKDTGLVRLYDYNGNEYKTLSYGTEDTPTSGGLVEYRRPIES